MRALRWGPLGEEKGVVAVLLALGLTAIVGFAAISLDAAAAYLLHRRLSDVADAGALAAAAKFQISGEGGEEAASSIIAGNGVDLPGAAITMTPSGVSQVELVASAAFIFAPLLGKDEALVGASSRAAGGSVSALTGAVPMGLEWSEFEFGRSYWLKLSSPDASSPGNFHALALGGRGATIYRENLKRGYGGVLRVGDAVETETGNMRGPTRDGVTWRISGDPNSSWDNFKRGSPRLIYVPVVGSFEAQGRKLLVIVGFASLFLEDYEDAGGGQVRGRFVRYLAGAEAAEAAGAGDYGLKVVRLVR